jgi:hypothetical protein
MTSTGFTAIKTKTSTAKLDLRDTSVLEQLAKLDVQSIGPETARKLIQFQFDVAQQDRVNALSEKAQRGALSPAEQSDLDEYIRVGNLLGMLQSRARQVLRNLKQAP